MPITRTPMVEDDGSGTTGTIINNPWKQEFYGQIDALTAGMVAPVYSTAPCVDVSGAGLTLSGSGWLFAKIGRLVAFHLHVIYPTTSNGIAAAIGTLSYPNGGYPGGGYTTYGTMKIWHLGGGATKILPLDGSTGAQFTNAQMSGSYTITNGIYITD
jgi:hypothetical protein